jgi:hypothetical protein
MSIDRTRTIEWEGKTLNGQGVVANRTPTKVSAEHDTMHTLAARLNDAHTGETKSAGVPANLYLPDKWNWGPAISSIDWY